MHQDWVCGLSMRTPKTLRINTCAVSMGWRFGPIRASVQPRFIASFAELGFATAGGATCSIHGLVSHRED